MSVRRNHVRSRRLLALLAALVLLPSTAHAQRTMKPVLHGQEWMAITGKPLAATAGAMIFQQGGNAVDAAAAMIAATSTMWDVLSWGGETQALIYNPQTGRSSASTRWASRPRAPRPSSTGTRAMTWSRSTGRWPR
jgi:gamma-glutamyltranspeptidase / glutathione hydrolase